MKRLSLVLLVLSWLTATPAFAQVQGGNLTGNVHDQQGGVLTGAAVTARGVDATLTRSAIKANDPQQPLTATLRVSLVRK